MLKHTPNFEKTTLNYRDKSERAELFLRRRRTGLVKPLYAARYVLAKRICRKDRRFFLLATPKKPVHYWTSKRGVFLGYEGFTSHRKAKKAFYLATIKSKKISKRNRRSRIRARALQEEEDIELDQPETPENLGEPGFSFIDPTALSQDGPGSTVESPH